MARRRRRRHISVGDPDGLQPGDDVGNRVLAREKQLPPDDIGNRRDAENDDENIPDDFGNRVDLMPTHEVSSLLSDIDGRKSKKRRYLNMPVRLGKYVQGGVNPAVSGDHIRATKAQNDEVDRRRSDDNERHRRDDAPSMAEQPTDGPVLRIARYFDLVDDDQHIFTLVSTPEEKRAHAEGVIERILSLSGRRADVSSRILEDGSRPKVLVTVDDFGPLIVDENPDVDLDDARDPLLKLGNGALSSVTYLINKIVNRFPADRIRLVVLPKSDEESFVEALNTHRQAHPETTTATSISLLSSTTDESGEGEPTHSVDERGERDSGGDRNKRSRNRRRGKRSDRPRNPDSSSTNSHTHTAEQPHARVHGADVVKADVVKADVVKAGVVEADVVKADVVKAEIVKPVAETRSKRVQVDVPKGSVAASDVPAVEPKKPKRAPRKKAVPADNKEPEVAVTVVKRRRTKPKAESVPSGE